MFWKLKKNCKLLGLIKMWHTIDPNISELLLLISLRLIALKPELLILHGSILNRSGILPNDIDYLFISNELIGISKIERIKMFQKLHTGFNYNIDVISYSKIEFKNYLYFWRLIHE